MILRYLKTLSLLLFFVCALNKAEAKNDTSQSPESYKITVSLDKQVVKIFRNGALIREIRCSSGLKPGSTPPGDFKTHARKEKDVWVEEDGTKIDYYYITKFNNNVAFHSLIEGKHALVETGLKLYKAGKPSSMGCVRVAKSDAKWIYDTIPLGTKVIVKNK